MLALASFPKKVHLHSWTGTCTLGWWQGKCAQTGTYTFTMALKLKKCNNLQGVPKQVSISITIGGTNSHFSAWNVSTWRGRLGAPVKRTLSKTEEKILERQSKREYFFVIVEVTSPMNQVQGLSGGL